MCPIVGCRLKKGKIPTDDPSGRVVEDIVSQTDATAIPDARHLPRNPMRRRLFVLAGTGVAAALTACSDETVPGRPGNADSGTPFVAARTPTPTPSPALQQFLALSSALTGVEQLDATAGQQYLNALQTPPAGGMPLDQFYQAAGISSGGSVPSFAGLTGSGVLDQPAAQITARTIVAYWYGGQVPGSGGAVTVVTYNHALGWQGLGFAASPGHCNGSFGFWSAKPA
jgi:hypothetical protein